MESAALAAVAAAAPCPLLVVRAVSDGVRGRVPQAALAALGEDGALRPGRLLAGLVASPSEWPALARLGLGLRAALRTLRGVVSQAGVDFGYGRAFADGAG
jgi:hypothetical protein